MVSQFPQNCEGEDQMTSLYERTLAQRETQPFPEEEAHGSAVMVLI